jgi:hypothetical protein
VAIALASASVVSFAASGCSRSPSSGFLVASTTSPVVSATSPPPPVPALTIYPLVVVHGIDGDPSTMAVFGALQGEGRAIVPALYAAEADQLQPGSLPVSCVVGAGYYKESVSDVLYDPDPNGVSHGSIGGNPTPRTDPFAANYTTSYVERLGRIIDGVRLATGSDRVDIACLSMGNIVSRAYCRWHSLGARGGGSKVHDMFLIAGPQRGLNAVEAYAIGWDRTPDEFFMRQGEIAEMCEEYPVWSGASFVDELNQDWDAFCAANGVTYAGVSGTGAYGNQVDPQGNPVIDTIATIVPNVVAAIINSGTVADLDPYYKIFWPDLIPEIATALSKPTDGVVRLALSRLDQPPFGRTYLWAPLEVRHQGEWNPEQSVTGSTVTSILARTFFDRTLGPIATVTTFDAVLVDAPGKASWIALESNASADTAGAQLVEEVLDASGNPTGGAVGYGAPVPAGAQRIFVAVPPGGGNRRYHAVLYGTNGALATRDVTFSLTNGALDSMPVTAFVGATSQLVGSSPAATVTFGSNAAPSDPTLRFSYRFDGGAWSPLTTSPTFVTPPLGVGEHRLEARSQQSTNGAGLLCQDTRGVVVGLVVDANGALSVRR